MPYVLSFEVHKRYDIPAATVSEAIACYDETYEVIGAWLKRHGASAQIRCLETGRVAPLYRGITAMEASQAVGELVVWRTDGETWIRDWVRSHLGK